MIIHQSFKCWRFKCYWMWCCIVGWVVPDLWRDHSFCASPLKMKAQHHILKDFNRQTHCSENLKSHTIKIVPYCSYVKYNYILTQLPRLVLQNCQVVSYKLNNIYSIHWCSKWEVENQPVSINNTSAVKLWQKCFYNRSLE